MKCGRFILTQNALSLKNRFRIDPSRRTKDLLGKVTLFLVCPSGGSGFEMFVLRALNKSSSRPSRHLVLVVTPSFCRQSKQQSLLRMLRLVQQQPFLPFKSAGIANHFPIVTDYAVTGDDN